MFDDRKTMILHSIINSYIDRGEPVGSKYLAKEYKMKISPATIRNEMSALEKMGFLEKAHSSSGRFPSDKGFRIYVDEILRRDFQDGEKTSFRKKDFDKIKEILDKRFDSCENVLTQATEILSTLTDLTAVNVRIDNKKEKPIKIELIKLCDFEYLFLAVFEGGEVINEKFSRNENFSADQLKILNRFLNEYINLDSFENGSYVFNENTVKALGAYNSLLKKLKEILDSELKRKVEGETIVKGLSNIFKFKEFQDSQNAFNLISFFEDEENLKDLLENDKTSLKVKIGDENSKAELRAGSVISSYYRYSPDVSGRIAIIGPRRMRYEKVISDIKLISLFLNK